MTNQTPEPWEEQLEEYALLHNDDCDVHDEDGSDDGCHCEKMETIKSFIRTVRQEAVEEFKGTPIYVKNCCIASVSAERQRILKALPKKPRPFGIKSYGEGWVDGYNACLSAVRDIINPKEL